MPLIETKGNDLKQAPSSEVASSSGFDQNSLNPFDALRFDQSRRSARLGAGRSLANLDFSDGIAALNHRRTRRDVLGAYKKTREAQPIQFARRGLINSGIRRGAGDELDAAQVKSVGDIDTDYQGKINESGLNRRSIEEALAEALASIDEDQAIARALAAAGISL